MVNIFAYLLNNVVNLYYQLNIWTHYTNFFIIIFKFR